MDTDCEQTIGNCISIVLYLCNVNSSHTEWSYFDYPIQMHTLSSRL